MIRSGEHELWEAHMAVSRQRASLNTFAERMLLALEPARRAFAKFAADLRKLTPPV